mmetsp:Transcript_34/g.167  ORF Transcript_34/g.167 Transcript_34/m.167 type:complete len:126 (+) Transcript_34:970-1347(+)
MEGLGEIAQSLTRGGMTTKQVTIPASLPKVVLKDSGRSLTDAICEARQSSNDCYLLLPHHMSNFPVLDSAFASQNSTVPFHIMTAGRRKPPAANANDLFSALGCCELYFLVPDNLTMTRGADRAS